MLVLLVRERQALAAATVSWSDFERVEAVYFAPHTSAERRAQLLAILVQARARVSAFYGPLRGAPTIIMAELHPVLRTVTYCFGTKAAHVPRGWMGPGRSRQRPHAVTSLAASQKSQPLHCLSCDVARST